MHVCMVSNSALTILPEAQGAINNYVFELSKKLSHLNTVTLLGRGGGQLDKGNFHVQPFSYVLPPNLLKYATLSGFTYSSFYYRYLIPKVQQLNKKNRISVLHVHSIFDTFAAMTIKRTIEARTVCSIHNTFKAPLLAGYCDKILANSYFIKSFLVNQAHFDKRKIDVLPIGVDTQIFKPDLNAKAKLGLQGRRVVLFVGRKVPYKGPEVLLEALPKVCSVFPETLAVMIGPDYIFGLGQRSYSAFLREKARKLNVENYISFQSFVPDSTLRLFLNAADVLVCPSIWQEPFGKVIIEAGACEKAVVATNVGGLPELVRDGDNGLLVPANSSIALADAILWLFQNKEMATWMGKNGRRVVENRFSYEAVAKKCQEIYESLEN